MDKTENLTPFTGFGYPSTLWLVVGLAGIQIQDMVRLFRQRLVDANVFSCDHFIS